MVESFLTAKKDSEESPPIMEDIKVSLHFYKWGLRWLVRLCRGEHKCSECVGKTILDATERKREHGEREYRAAEAAAAVATRDAVTTHAHTGAAEGEGESSEDGDEHDEVEFFPQSMRTCTLYRCTYRGEMVNLLS